MARILFKVKCEKGHNTNALIWEGQSIQSYIEDKKCNSCGSPLQLSKWLEQILYHKLLIHRIMLQQKFIKQYETVGIQW